MPKVIKVYTTNYCPYCMRAKALLKQRGITFTEIEFDIRDDAKWEELYKLSKLKTVPQIFADETLIGGFAELERLDAKDQLASLK
ncbi:MAG: glutaredoxin domain-containing protein [Bdellovibrionota bacterium]